MKTNPIILCSLGVVLLLGSCGQKQTIPSEYQPNISTTASPKGTDLFKPDSAAIAKNYKIPEWFTNAKFGIFIHWGVYSVPAYASEKYPPRMYQKGSDVNKYHLKHYGELTKFGYKDFIPMFKAENFDAERWVKLFKEAGAKYIIPVAEHHDGFSMYHSYVNKWNAYNMGPKRDILAEMKKAILANGLHFGLSSHRCENAWYYAAGMQTPSDVQDTSLTLYGERMHRFGGKGMTPKTEGFPGSNEHSRKLWLKHTYELIDNYQPELFWFDWGVGKYPFQPTFYRFLAYYYNNAKDWNKGVVVNTKFGYGDNIQVYDIERGKADKIKEYPWQTDTSIGKHSWGYIKNEENKSPDHIVDDLVDIVSKNGNLLLNVGPKADGTISPEQIAVLKGIGAWMKINSESIYDTRPWIIWGEGETKATTGYMTDNTQSNYTAQDIRYVKKGNVIYATCLAWGENPVHMKSLSHQNLGKKKITSITMLGSNETIAWKQQKNKVTVHFPKVKPSKYAHVFKIEIE